MSTLLLLHSQQGLTIINTNLQDDFLTPKKLCIVMFGTGRLKITMKSHSLLRLKVMKP